MSNDRLTLAEDRKALLEDHKALLEACNSKDFQEAQRLYLR